MASSMASMEWLEDAQSAEGTWDDEGGAPVSPREITEGTTQLLAEDYEQPCGVEYTIQDGLECRPSISRPLEEYSSWIETQEEMSGQIGSNGGRAMSSWSGSPKALGAPWGKVGVAKGSQKRITVWNKRTLRKLSGNAAPMEKNLLHFLRTKPDWEIYRGQDTHIEHSDKMALREKRISIWNKVEQRKFSGNAAPSERKLAEYLRKHPECEIYDGQDKFARRWTRPKGPGEGYPEGSDAAHLAGEEEQDWNPAPRSPKMELVPSTSMPSAAAATPMGVAATPGAGSAPNRKGAVDLNWLANVERALKQAKTRGPSNSPSLPGILPGSPKSPAMLPMASPQAWSLNNAALQQNAIATSVTTSTGNFTSNVGTMGGVAGSYGHTVGALGLPGALGGPSAGLPGAAGGVSGGMPGSLGVVAAYPGNMVLPAMASSAPATGVMNGGTAMATAMHTPVTAAMVSSWSPYQSTLGLQGGQYLTVVPQQATAISSSAAHVMQRPKMAPTVSRPGVPLVAGAASTQLATLVAAMGSYDGVASSAASLTPRNGATEGVAAAPLHAQVAPVSSAAAPMSARLLPSCTHIAQLVCGQAPVANGDAASLCEKSNISFPAPKAELWQCGQCGFENLQESAVCGRCGHCVYPDRSWDMQREAIFKQEGNGIEGSRKRSNIADEEKAESPKRRLLRAAQVASPDRTYISA